MKQSNGHNLGDEFGKNINSLLDMLKKMIKDNKFDNEEMQLMFNKMAKDKDNVNLNVFFAFMPVIEDFDEFDEPIDDELLFNESELKFELSSNDQNFLKQHGMKF